MAGWLMGRKNRKELPEYSSLRSALARPLPADLTRAHESEYFKTNREEIERELLKAPQRPLEDAALFTGLLESNRSAAVTINLPDNKGKCLPVFSTPVRAADYVQELLASGPRVSCLQSSPLEFLQVIRGIEKAGIETVAVDRCPRCSVFTTVGTASLRASDQIIDLWCIFKATQRARENLYFSYALESARTGRVEIARDVALNALGHVNLEDPRQHLLLGQLAVKLGDRKLLREARAYLHFLGHVRWERKLDQVALSGVPDFENPR